MASTPALRGTYRSIEHAIVEAIHVLGQESPHGDGSCRCKDIFAAVQYAAISVDGRALQGGLRFAKFSSALCGRRSSQRLFQRACDGRRVGSWWKLRLPYEEALLAAMPLGSWCTGSGADEGAGSARQGCDASREEIVRSMFLSLIPLGMMSSETQDKNGEDGAVEMPLSGTGQRRP